MRLLPNLPAELILAAYERAGGNELEGKSDSPESSSALVANAFGWFLDRPDRLPPLPGLDGVTWPAMRVELEANVRFPWSGGRHPWLDVLVETPSHVIGLESKRYEPYRHRHVPEFSDAFSRDVWPAGMQPYLAMLAALKSQSADLWALDAAQLVKHALALSTQAKREGKKAALLYLYADPGAWPDGKEISRAGRAAHEEHLKAFSKSVQGADVQFAFTTYRQLCTGWQEACAKLAAHASAVMSEFRLDHPAAS